jgi:hypothetical protein
MGFTVMPLNESVSSVLTGIEMWSSAVST